MSPPRLDEETAEFLAEGLEDMGFHTPADWIRRCIAAQAMTRGGRRDETPYADRLPFGEKE